MLRHLSAFLLLGAAAAAQQSSTIRVDVDLVRVVCSATQHGIPVKALQKTDFIVREDSTPQEIKYFWQEADLPLTIGLVVDVSASQSGLIKNHREIIARFLKEVLRPEDRAMLITVGTDVRLVTDMTHSVDELMVGMDHIDLRDRDSPLLGEPCKRRRRFGAFPCGGSVIWNSVYYAAKLKMHAIEGRKALLVLSDGFDTGSDHGLGDAIEAAQSAETAVYTIKSVSPLVVVMMLPRLALPDGMHRLSEETGGAPYGMLHGDLVDVFNQIETDLRNQYVLAYTSTNHARDGKFRKLQVSSTRKGIEVRTRTGYRAPSGSSADGAQ